MLTQQNSEFCFHRAVSLRHRKVLDEIGHSTQNSVMCVLIFLGRKVLSHMYSCCAEFFRAYWMLHKFLLAMQNSAENSVMYNVVTSFSRRILSMLWICDLFQQLERILSCTLNFYLAGKHFLICVIVEQNSAKITDCCTGFSLPCWILLSSCANLTHRNSRFRYTRSSSPRFEKKINSVQLLITIFFSHEHIHLLNRLLQRKNNPTYISASYVEIFADLCYLPCLHYF